jgi:nicotinate (nicotinamide) nucleotide adenylyltransferase
VEFYARSTGKPERVGILAGSFNPLTVAHCELAAAAHGHVDEVVCVVPRAFPHKPYFGATLDERLEMIEMAQLPVPHSIAASDRGLFVEIARECRAHYGEETRFYFLCGADAADRILSWDYGRPGVVEEMLAEFELLVAARGDEFEAPPAFRSRVHRLDLRGNYHDVSSTIVRERVRQGGRWEHLVPEQLVEKIRSIYS